MGQKQRSLTMSEIHDYFSGRTEDPLTERSKLENPGMQIAHAHFLNLSGASLDFYGADTGCNAFKVDDIVFKVLEDPEDGYRSCLGAIDYTDSHNSIFFGRSIAKVKIVSFEEIEVISFEEVDEDRLSYIHSEGRTRDMTGYQLVDVDDGHVWLRFGTDYSDDYYPYFVFRYFPKPGGEST